MLHGMNVKVIQMSASWEARRFSDSQEIPAFYGTRRFITAVTIARNLSLSWARSIQSIPPHPTSWIPILILSPHLRLCLPSLHIKIIIPYALTMPSLSHLTSCTPTKSNLYLANSLAAPVNKPALYRPLTFHVPNLISLFRSLGRTKASVRVQGLLYKCFATWYVLTARSC